MDPPPLRFLLYLGTTCDRSAAYATRDTQKGNMCSVWAEIQSEHATLRSCACEARCVSHVRNLERQ